MSLKTKQQGFTIVELLIVIVVIGILAALVITTFTGIQQKARNTERTTDIKAIHGQLEAYQAQYAHYPSVADMNNTTTSTWRKDNLKGLDEDAVKDPKSTAATPSFATTATANQYAYAPAPANCDNTAGNECSSYVLTATLEGGGTFVKNSLN